MKKITLVLTSLAATIFLSFFHSVAHSQNATSQAIQNSVGQPRPVQLLPIDPHAPFDAQAFYRTFRHGREKVNDVGLHYVIGGKGEPVVLLNGHPETWWTWHKIMPALAQRHTVLAIDLRGTGESDKPLTGYDAATLAQDVRQLVQKLGLPKRINLVSYDVSGRVGYAYAADFPTEVNHLVLMETLLPGYGLEEAMNVAKGGSYHFGFFANVEMAEFLIKGQEREFLRTIIQSALYDKAALTEEDIDTFARPYAAPGGIRGFLSHYAAFLGDAQPNRERAARGKLATPVLALYGTGLGRETAVLPQTLLPLFDTVQGEGVAGSGHFIMEERPDYLAARLLDFFATK